MGFPGWADRAGAPVLQQNAPGLVPGGLTGLEHRQSGLWEGPLQEVLGTEFGTKRNSVQVVQWQPSGGVRRRQAAYVTRHFTPVRQVRAETGTGAVGEGGNMAHAHGGTGVITSGDRSGSGPSVRWLRGKASFPPGAPWRGRTGKGKRQSVRRGDDPGCRQAESRWRRPSTGRWRRVIWFSPCPAGDWQARLVAFVMLPVVWAGRMSHWLTPGLRCAAERLRAGLPERWQETVSGMLDSWQASAVIRRAIVGVAGVDGLVAGERADEAVKHGNGKLQPLRGHFHSGSPVRESEVHCIRQPGTFPT